MSKSDRIIEQNNVAKGTIRKVKKCWWIKVNQKSIRLHALDGATFPHIMTFTYEVDGIKYKKIHRFKSRCNRHLWKCRCLL